MGKCFTNRSFPILLFFVFGACTVTTQDAIGQLTASQPFGFYENRGQITDTSGAVRREVLFASSTPDMQLFFTERGVRYVFAHLEAIDTISPLSAAERRRFPEVEGIDIDYALTTYSTALRFADANPRPAIRAEQPLNGSNNYYYAHCPEGITGVQRYGRLVYENVYDNIDVIFYSAGSRLKYDVVVRPGGDPSQIGIYYEGGGDVHLLEDGGLQSVTPLGVITETPPYTYQNVDGSDRKREVASRFIIDGNVARFALGEYDLRLDLVIDPGVVWERYLGGSDRDEGTDIAVDAQGNVISVGRTWSVDFPATTGTLETSYSGGALSDAYVAKLDKDGALIWATYFGGTDKDEITSLAISENDNIIVAGNTISRKIPLLPGAYQDTIGGIGNTDIFLAKFTRHGVLLWSTYFGGSYGDRATEIAVNANGEVALVGWTNVEGSGFPLIAPSLKTTNNGFQEPYAARISGATGHPLWSHFIGGTEEDRAEGVAIDDDGHLYIVGTTFSDDFITTGGANLSTYGGDGDMFLMHLSNLGDTVWSTYIGDFTPENREIGQSIALDHNGDFIIIGISINENGAERSIYSKISGDGQLRWQTPPPAAISSGRPLKVTAVPEGNIFVVGDIPASCTGVENPRDCDCDCTPDGFFAHLSEEGEFLDYLKLDGDFKVLSGGIAASDAETVYIGGLTEDTQFPSFTGQPMNAMNGLSDAFIIRWGCDLAPEITASGPLSFCRGGETTLDAGDGLVEYLWSNGATTQTITVSETGQYSVMVTDHLECVESAEPIDVLVHEPPQPVIQLSDLPILCAGEELQLDAGDAFAEYRWSNGGDTPAITIDAPGDYSVEVTDEFGCVGSTTVSIEARATPVPLLGAEQTDFGDLEGCEGNSRRPLTLTNVEDGPITLTMLQPSDPAFSVLAPALPLTIEANEQIVIVIDFSPTVSGETLADLEIAGQPCDFMANARLRGSKASIDVSADVAEVQFDEALVCASDGSEQEITLRNTSGAPATITGVDIAAPYSVIEPAFPQDLADGEELIVRIAFAPNQEGVFDAAAVFHYSTGACDAELNIPLTGSGIDAELIAETEALDFGLLNGCENEREADIIVTNSGALDLEIAAVDVSGPFNVVSGGGVVAPNETAQVTLQFTPVSEGEAAGQATIRYRVGGCEKTLTVDLSGERRGLSLTTDVATIDVGEIVLCAVGDVNRTITVSNVSEVEGRVKEVRTDGPVTTNVTVGDEVSASALREYSLTVTPDSEGALNGRVEIIFEPCDITVTIDVVGAAVDVNLLPAADVIIGPEPGGTIGTLELAYRNTGSAAATISRIEGVEPPLRVVSPSLPATVEPGAALTVEIEYTTPVGALDRTVRLIVGLPCALSVESGVRIVGTDERERVRLTAAVPDMEARTTDRNYAIPVILGESEGLPSVTLDSFEVELHFNATLYTPQSALSGGLASSEVQDAERRVTIVGSWPEDITSGDTLTGLLGFTKIGNAVSTEIEFVLMRAWDSDGITDVEVAIQSGSLHLVNICHTGGTRLLNRLSDFGIGMMYPNPSAGPVRIEVRALSGTASQLAIHTLSGERVFSESWMEPAIAGHSARSAIYAIDHDLPAGVYTVTLSSGLRRDARTLVVVR